MKTKVLFLLFILGATISCKKGDGDDEKLFPKYQSIFGVWKPFTISYDSANIRVTKPIRYDRLVINNDLSYKIYVGSTNQIEDGTIQIITQNDEKLELFFGAEYPSYSSFAGSHVFGVSNLVLDAFSNDELIFKSIKNSYFQNTEFRFKKY